MGRIAFNKGDASWVSGSGAPVGFCNCCLCEAQGIGAVPVLLDSCHPIVALRLWAGERDRAGEAEERINKARTDSATDYR